MKDKTMKKTFLALAVVAACSFGTAASAQMTKEAHKTEKDRIEADYKAAKAQCDGLKDNAKDICGAEAKGKQKVAKAELEQQYKPNARNEKKVMDAKADASYELAKEKCDDMKGNDKDVCMKDAKAARTTAKENAKVAKTSANNAGKRNDNVSEAKKDAAEEKREAEYKAAKERCDAMSGAGKDNCQNEAKAKYNK
jgi:hypothetical protein